MRKANKQWSNDFHRLVEDFEYDGIDEAGFRNGLLALGYSKETATWLIFKMTETREVR